MKKNKKKKQQMGAALKVDVTPLAPERADELLRIMREDPRSGTGGNDGYFDDCPICIAMRQWERDDQLN